MKKNNDMQAKFFIWLLHLKEEKNKQYSFMPCDKNIIYKFNNYNEFKNYFIQNGFDNISDDLLELCRMITTKKGTIIALKGLCDYTIKKHKINKELTQKEIDDIHSRGKITPSEKVEEWERLELCAPGDAIGSASNRCCAFDNCHDCLKEYVSSRSEYDKIEFKSNNTIILKK